MEFKDFDFNNDRVYKTGKLISNDFYKDDSINDKFKEFLDKKYNNKVECYIKPFGTSDSVTSFNVQMLDHNNTYRKYTNQVIVSFSRVKNSDDTYVLGTEIEGELMYKVDGYSEKLAKPLFADAIEFLDNIKED